MFSLKYARSLNNQGVHLLVSGDSSSAMRSFKRAVRILKEAVNDTTFRTGMSEEATQPFCESTSVIPSLQDMHFYTYDHGIMLPANEENEETLTLYSAIVLFNMALASHHQGRLLGHEKALKNASLLYSGTAKLLSGSIMSDNMSATILTLLALNNKSQIHYTQCEHRQSVDCLKEISKIMISVEVLYSIINHNILKGLLLNTMLLNVPTAAQAA
jgi:hypothetical protein